MAAANPPNKAAPPISFWSPALSAAEADAEGDVPVDDPLTPAPEAVLVPDVVVAPAEPEVVEEDAPVALLDAPEAVELAVEAHETADGRLVTPAVRHRFWA